MPHRFRRTLVVGALAAATCAPLAPVTHAAAGAARPVVYLTFDDGPSPHTPLFLDLLARYHVRATFFEIGRAVSARPGISRQVVAAGHRLGNHTWSHKFLPALSASAIRAEVSRAGHAFAAAVGYQPRCVRPPGGASTAHTRAVLASLGKTTAMWSIDTRDWSPKRSVSGVLAELNKAHDGSIILMHDGSPQYRKTLSALSTWLARNASRFEFRSLGSC